MKIKSTSLREVKQELEKSGFSLVSSRKHLIYKDSTGRQVVIPNHPGDVSKPILTKIYKAIS